MGSSLHKLSTLIYALVVFLCLQDVHGQLSRDFYASSCPGVEDIVRNFLQSTFDSDPTAPAAMCRLAFHDCQVDKCDASIMLDNGPGVVPEIQSQGNAGIRRLDIIDNLKDVLEQACPQTVSCADIIALAGRDAAALSGGPSAPILLGRLDGFTADAANADRELPPSTASVNSFLSIFASYGMSTPESVSILGAHTLGVTSCSNVVNRLYPFPAQDLSFLFANVLRDQCPFQFSTSSVDLDSTSQAFDNQYFQNLKNGEGVMTIDAEMVGDPRTAPSVARFASNQADFFNVFSSAYVKLTSKAIISGNEGEVRFDCRSVN